MIRIFHDYETLSQSAAEYVVTIGKRCITRRGKFELVLSGGKTPEKCYRILGSRFAHDHKLWEKTHVYWADERCVPADSPESNYRLARETLLDFVDIPVDQIHRIPADDANPRLVADLYDAEFPLSPDLVVLGMGPDGHTASIFPHSPAITETRRHVMYVEVPVEPSRRITITPRVIANAIEVLVLVYGEEKAEAMRHVFSDNGDVQDTPGLLVRRALWFVDRAAAEKITKSILVDAQ